MSSVPCTTKKEYIAYIHNYSHLRALYIVYYRVHKPSTFYDQHLAAVGKKTYLYNCKKICNRTRPSYQGKYGGRVKTGKRNLITGKKALSLMWPVKPVGLLWIVSNASYSNTDCMNLLAFSYWYRKYTNMFLCLVLIFCQGNFAVLLVFISENV